MTTSYIILINTPKKIILSLPIFPRMYFISISPPKLRIQFRFMSCIDYHFSLVPFRLEQCTIFLGKEGEGLSSGKFFYRLTHILYLPKCLTISSTHTHCNIMLGVKIMAKINTDLQQSGFL